MEGAGGGEEESSGGAICNYNESSLRHGGVCGSRLWVRRGP